MSTACTTFVAIIVLTNEVMPGVASAGDETELLNKLLTNINSVVNPTLNMSQPIEVTFKLELIQIRELEDAKQLLTCKYWVRQSWRNEFITWNPMEWGGIEELRIDPNRVWTPDVVLYNNGGSDFSGGVHKYPTKIKMRYDGEHTWGSPATFTSSCRVNAMYFPFDVQECSLKFGSWTQNTDKLILKADDEQMLVGKNYIPSSEWYIENIRWRVHTVCYKNSGGVPFEDITFTLTISREGLSYLFFMVTPCLIVVLTTLFSFSLPPESGERLIVIVTNLLCFALFLFMTSESLPNNSDDVAIISIFYLVFMVESCFSTFIACSVLTVYHRGQQNDPPQIPHWLKIIFWHVYKKIYKVEKKLSTPAPKRQFRRPLHASLAPIMGKVLEEISSPNDVEEVFAEPNVQPVEEQAPLDVRFADRKRSRTLSIHRPSQVNRPFRTSQSSEGSEEPGKPSNPKDERQKEILGEILNEVEYITSMNEELKRREALRLDWEVIGYMLDRLYFWIFLFMVIFSALYILGLAYIEKHKIVAEFEKHVRNDKMVKGCRNSTYTLKH